MKPVAIRTNIFAENLPTEVVLYNKLTKEVHCLNRSAAIVWENADGTRSVDELALLVERELNVATGRDMVLVALDQLAKANLLEHKTEVASEEVSSRRAVAKRLAMAGISAAMLPVIASMTAPSASAATTVNQATTDGNQAIAALESQGILGPNSTLTNYSYTGPDNGTDAAADKKLYNYFSIGTSDLGTNNYGAAAHYFTEADPGVTYPNP